MALSNAPAAAAIIASSCSEIVARLDALSLAIVGGRASYRNHHSRRIDHLVTAIVAAFDAGADAAMADHALIFRSIGRMVALCEVQNSTERCAEAKALMLATAERFSH